MRLNSNHLSIQTQNNELVLSQWLFCCRDKNPVDRSALRRRELLCLTAPEGESVMVAGAWERRPELEAGRWQPNRERKTERKANGARLPTLRAHIYWHLPLQRFTISPNSTTNWRPSLQMPEPVGAFAPKLPQYNCFCYFILNKIHVTTYFVDVIAKYFMEIFILSMLYYWKAPPSPQPPTRGGGQKTVKAFVPVIRQGWSAQGQFPVLWWQADHPELLFWVIPGIIWFYP